MQGSCKGYPLVQTVELIHPAKMHIFRDAGPCAVSRGCGDMEGLNMKSKGSNVYVKGCRVFWQAESKEKWKLSRLLIFRLWKRFYNPTP